MLPTLFTNVAIQGMNPSLFRGSHVEYFCLHLLLIQTFRKLTQSHVSYLQKGKSSINRNRYTLIYHNNCDCRASAKVAPPFGRFSHAQNIIEGEAARKQSSRLHTWREVFSEGRPDTATRPGDTASAPRGTVPK